MFDVELFDFAALCDQSRPSLFRNVRDVREFKSTSDASVYAVVPIEKTERERAVVRD